jgi:hypothetical protein
VRACAGLPRKIIKFFTEDLVHYLSVAVRFVFGEYIHDKLAQYLSYAVEYVLYKRNPLLKVSGGFLLIWAALTRKTSRSSTWPSSEAPTRWYVVAVIFHSVPHHYYLPLSFVRHGRQVVVYAYPMLPRRFLPGRASSSFTVHDGPHSIFLLLGAK